MRETLQHRSQGSARPEATDFSRSNVTSRRAAAQPDEQTDAWATSWSREAASSASYTSTAWWADTEEGYTLLQRLALAHLLVGVCVALALGWQVWHASGPTLTPAIGLVVAVGGALALLLSRLDDLANHPAMHILARLSLIIVDLSAAGGVLWIRGGAGWTLLVLLPPIALAVTFFAERGGALATATATAALMIVAVNSAQQTATSGWMSSLLVFLGVAALIVAFLGIYSTHLSETSENLRWLLSDTRATSERLHGERHNLLVRLRAAEQAREPLLRERARLGEAATELTMLARRMSQGAPSAAEALQAVRPEAYGPLAELARALAELARVPNGAGNPSLALAFDAPVRVQSQALESLDDMARALCVGANELVTDALALEPGISLIGSRQYTQTLWQLEQRLRTQATHMALLGTQLADIRAAQENLEALVARAAAGARTPSVFASSDIRYAGLSGQVSQFSGPQVTFGSSAIRRATAAQSAQTAQPPRHTYQQTAQQAAQQAEQQSDGTVRWGNWQNETPMAYNRGV